MDGRIVVCAQCQQRNRISADPTRRGVFTCAKCRAVLTAAGDDAATAATPDPRPQRYRAFLSYSHSDQKVAAWLHHKLENYRVPRALVGSRTPSGPAPAKLGRVFRDDAEFAASDNLGAAIEEALAESGALIVLCSPEAARSQWVNAEIKRFTEIRPGGKVLALAVAGTMGSEIMPPALLQQQRRDQALGSEPFVPDLAAGPQHGADTACRVASWPAVRRSLPPRTQAASHAPVQCRGRGGGIPADRRLRDGLEHSRVALARLRGRGSLRGQSRPLRPRRRPRTVRAAETRLAPRRVLAQGRGNGIAANRAPPDPGRDGHLEKQGGRVLDPQGSVRHDSRGGCAGRTHLH